jgi:hypothetical protein
MAQGLNIVDLPSVTKENIDVDDYFLFEEKLSGNVYSTKKLNASYLLKLKTEASNISTVYDEASIFAGITVNAAGSNVLNFRNLQAGNNISLTQQDSNIKIDANVNAENIQSDTTNSYGSYIGKNTTSSYLQFKNFSGLGGLETTTDSTKVYIKNKDHHYFFIPASPLSLNVNETLLDYYINFSTTSLDPIYDGEWYSNIFTCDLQSTIDNLPVNAKNSILNTTNCLALVRIEFESNTGGNSIHDLELKGSTEQDWNLKTQINPRGNWHSLWEQKSFITTTVGFNTSNKQFNIRIKTDSNQKETAYWKLGLKVIIEGFFV